MITTIKATDNRFYKVMNGTYYHPDTNNEMVILLERLRLAGARVRFHWGDAETGLDWGDIYDVAGTIGRSMGPIKIPILIHSRRSMGGGPLLDHCIVRIAYTKKRGGKIYEHPQYHTKAVPAAENRG